MVERKAVKLLPIEIVHAVVCGVLLGSGFAPFFIVGAIGGCVGALGVQGRESDRTGKDLAKGISKIYGYSDDRWDDQN